MTLTVYIDRQYSLDRCRKPPKNRPKTDTLVQNNIYPNPRIAQDARFCELLQ